MHIHGQYSSTYISFFNPPSGMVNLSTPISGTVLVNDTLDPNTEVVTLLLSTGCYSLTYMVSAPVYATVGLLVSYIDPSSGLKTSVVKDRGVVLPNELTMIRTSTFSGYVS